jgi:hypothetical protein
VNLIALSNNPKGTAAAVLKDLPASVYDASNGVDVTPVDKLRAQQDILRMASI